MPQTTALLAGRLQAAFDTIAVGADPVLRRSERCDYQANGALALAKALGRNPREVAEAVVSALDLEGIATVEVAGPGFVNLQLVDAFIDAQLEAQRHDARLGVPLGAAEVVVVDYSSPNVAKEMHAGHLRSTVIGDAIARLEAFGGATVRRENHIGDWGTPFGMLIEHLIDLGEAEAVHELSLGDLDGFYRAARAKFEAEEPFAERSRQRVVLLQQGDAETLERWRLLVGASVRYFSGIYEELGVLLTAEDVVGESAYNDQLDQVVDDLDAAGLLVTSDGASCVFPDGFTNREGEPLPLIVRKADGGYGYAATDLACIRDRVSRLGAQRLLYVVGADQHLHLEMCFAVAALAGWLPEGVEAIHVGFGNMLGTDHKKFKTRAGDVVKLADLLAEAQQRAAAAVRERNADLDEAAVAQVARSVGVGAVKYADLSTERGKDYVFDWNRMLQAEGNTGPYLQYAHARLCSVLRRAEAAGAEAGVICCREPAERALAMVLLGFCDAVAAATEGALPSKLCTYLFDLAQAVTTFYEHCPVLTAPPEVRANRLALVLVARDTLRLGLSLLGIDAPPQM